MDSTWLTEGEAMICQVDPTARITLKNASSRNMHAFVPGNGECRHKIQQRVLRDCSFGLLIDTAGALLEG